MNNETSRQPGGSGSDHTLAYEQVLCALLDIRTLEELRDVFSRRLTQEAAAGFAAALDATRARKQPDSFALGWAIEAVIAARRRAAGDDITRMFNDPAFHAPPSESAIALYNDMWEARGEHREAKLD